MPLPVVFIHGIRISRTMWDQVLPLLSRPALAVDLPGHGTRRGEPFTMAGATAAVAQGVDAVGGRALLVGLSLGGYVGIAAAGEYPRRVAGLVAVGCTARPARLAWLYRVMGAVAARAPERAARISAAGVRRSLPAPAAEAFLAGGQSFEVFPAAVAAVAGHDQLAALAGYPGPVWLVNGDSDPFRVHERDFLAACRDGRRLRLPRTGHVTVMADPARLAAIVDEAAGHCERPPATG